MHRPAPKNEDEMMVAIFEYIDRLFNIVRPRRVLYMAIDGVVSVTVSLSLGLSSKSGSKSSIWTFQSNMQR